MKKTWLKYTLLSVVFLLILRFSILDISQVNADTPIGIIKGDGAFHFGDEVYYYCSQVDRNNAAIAVVGYQDYFGKPPEYQKKYYAIVKIESIGNACGGMSAGVSLKLPAHTTLTISPEDQVFCYHNGDPSDFCPQALPVNAAGQVGIPSDSPDATWSLTNYEYWLFFIPVVTDSALVNDSVQGFIDVIDDGNHTSLDPTIQYSVSGPPIDFTKTSPLNLAIKQSTSPTLRWKASPNVTNYEYCLVKGKTQQCSTGWKTTQGNDWIKVSGLTPAATYSWTVRATNEFGTVLSDDNTWWTFTVSPKPGAFSKTKPVNAATNQPTTVTIAWAASSQAASYEYCVDKTNDNQCSSGWKSVGLLRSKNLTGLSAGATYYWQVRAKNSGGLTLSNNGIWWSFKVKK